MSYTDVYQAYQSWRAYASNFEAYRTIQSMDALHNDLFITPFAKEVCQEENRQ